jgi:hypothetical protein
MSIAPGTRIGPYEVVSPLGKGGMGKVYRARDSRLGRDVAVKLLPDVFASDPDRRARFEREAQMLAALNHSHIAAIYGIEESSERRALVLERMPVVIGFFPYDVAPDGRFLVSAIRDAAIAQSSPLTVVLNWQAALKR